MKKTLIVVDVQKFFLSDKTQGIVTKIREYLYKIMRVSTNLSISPFLKMIPPLLFGGFRSGKDAMTYLTRTFVMS